MSFNTSLVLFYFIYIIAKKKNCLIVCILYSAILYSLSKQALNMRAFKLARQILSTLQELRIPSKYQVNLSICLLVLT